ncbi:Uncharacterised protein [Bergeyella zoohelcum]|uniref:Uncharacterized protein n=1 Tax=Bergeyella zoohelcum TaxID=1015 RepID=A0A7Z8YNL1_9FLAO|nr:Uncharacterised protein [Bergeyella zoohelcum]
MLIAWDMIVYNIRLRRGRIIRRLLLLDTFDPDGVIRQSMFLTDDSNFSFLTSNI